MHHSISTEDYETLILYITVLYWDVYV